MAGPPEKDTGPVITVAPAITHFTEPLDAEGYVDFHTALNNELGRGIAASENAAIPLLQAMGPCEGNIEAINRVLKALGAAPWSPGMPDFQDFRPTGPTAQRSIDEQGQAMQVPWKSDEHPEIAAILALNEEPLRLIAAAVQKPKYFRPMLVAKPGETLVSVLLPDVQSQREIARQLVCRAMLHLGEGRPLEAQQDLLTVHRLGRTVGQGACLIENLVGIAIDAIATAADNTWAAHPALTADQIAAYRKQLVEVPMATNMVRRIDLCERAMTMDVTQAIARGRLNTRDGSFDNLMGISSEGQWLNVGQFANAMMALSLDWNVTLRTLNQQFDGLVGAAKISDRQQRLAALDRFEDQLKATRAETASFKGFVTTVMGGSNSRGKTFGNVLGTLLMPAVKQALTAEDQSTARHHLNQVMLALSEYQRREGKFPGSLTALAPQYLSTVPDDLMSGKPFRYASDGSSYRLYSFGRNGQDDGGRMGDGADDILMAYPPPAR